MHAVTLRPLLALSVEMTVSPGLQCSPRLGRPAQGLQFVLGVARPKPDAPNVSGHSGNDYLNDYAYQTILSKVRKTARRPRSWASLSLL
jgi:hypothetical protein